MAADRDPLRAVAQYRVDRLLAEDGVTAGDTAPPGNGGPGAAGRMEQRGSWADEVIRQAIARGDFDHLSLAGKPIPGLTRHDPDWWLRSFIEREHVTGVGPEAYLLRRDDAALDQRIDEEHTEAGVRELVEEFNARVIAARRQLLGGPPVVTRPRDADLEVAHWHDRRAESATPAPTHTPTHTHGTSEVSRAGARPTSDVGDEGEGRGDEGEGRGGGRSASWYRGQWLSRRRASPPAASSDGRSGATDLP